MRGTPGFHNMAGDAGRGFWHFSMSGAALPAGLLMSSLRAAAAEPGESVSTFAGSMTGLATAGFGWGFGKALGWRMFGALRFGLGPTFTYVTALAGLMGASEIGESVAKPIRFLQKLDHRMRRLEMGGDYVDTERAATMRQRAVQEMSGSLLNARSVLGQEALLMHQ